MNPPDLMKKNLLDVIAISQNNFQIIEVGNIIGFGFLSTNKELLFWNLIANFLENIIICKSFESKNLQNIKINSKKDLKTKSFESKKIPDSNRLNRFLDDSHRRANKLKQIQSSDLNKKSFHNEITDKILSLGVKSKF